MKAGKGKYFPFKIIRQDRKGRCKREADISTIMEIFLREEKKKKKKPLLNVKDSKESLFSYLPLKNYKIDRQKKIKKKTPNEPLYPMLMIYLPPKTHFQAVMVFLTGPDRTIITRGLDAALPQS